MTILASMATLKTGNEIGQSTEAPAQIRPSTTRKPSESDSASQRTRKADQSRSQKYQATRFWRSSHYLTRLQRHIKEAGVDRSSRQNVACNVVFIQVIGLRDIEVAVTVCRKTVRKQERSAR